MAYTQDQYLGFAQQLAPYLSDPTQLVQQAGKLGLGVEDVAKAAQTFNPDITTEQIQSYFKPAGISYQPDPYNQMYQDIAGRAPDAEGLNYWRQQFGAEISPEERDVFRRTALDFAGRQAFGRSLTDAEKAQLYGFGTVQQANDWAAQKGLDWTNLQQQKLDAAQTAFGRQLSDAEKAEVSSLGSVQQVNDWAAQKGQEWLSAQQAASAAPAGGTSNVGISALDRFYDPVLKQQWVIESASDYGTIDTFNKPKGGGGLVYINPQTGEALDRETYLQVANTPEAVEYRAEQERIAAANAKLFRPGNTLDNPLVGVTNFDDGVASILSSNPNIAAALGHASTFVRPYKVINGQLQEVTDADITPQDIASNSVYFYIGGATGGPDRQRMAQLYQSKGDKLVPVGDPSFYKGEHPDQAIMDFAKIALPIGLSFIPGLGTAIGSALGATGAAASALGSGVLSFGTQLAMGADPLQALKGAVLSSAGGYLGSQVSSMLPTEVAGIGKNVITQLVTTGKLDPAALATSVGTSFATDALAAETGMDKATAGKLVTAGLQAFQGNELAALTSLAQAGIQSGLAGTGVSAQSPQDRAAFLDANASLQGAGALSPITAEDEQIAIQQRVTKANQAIADYAGPGNDLSREGLVSQLQSFGFTADQAEGYAKQADQRINMSRVGADVMNRYSKIDPEFGMPQLDRDTAIQELVAAGFTSDRANEILNGIDAQNAIKLENRLSVQSAYQNFTQGKGSEDQLRSALTSAGYNDAQINELVTRGRGVIAGSQLTGGEQAQERASQLPDIRGEIAGKSNFNEAYALAREKLGADATFTWQGKTYSTATAAERPDLSGATSKPSTEVPYVAPNGMHNRAAFIQAGGGTSDADYAKYVNAVNALISEGKSGTLITPASVNSAGKDLPPTTGPVTMEKPRVDSVLGSVAAQGVASFGANSIAGALSALGFTDAGRTVLDKANQIAVAATAAEGADITQGKRDIDAAIQKVGSSSGIRDFATNVGNLVSTAFNNPKAFGATVGSEVVEEVLQLATLKFPGSFLVKETVASALENGGAAYNTEYESQIAKGASKEDAHLAAQKAAGTAAGVTVALAGGAAGLGKVAGKVFGSQADEAASGVSQVGKTTLKESAQEVLEEGSIAGSIDLALGRPVDAVNALTNMTGGALYGGVTAGSIQGTKLDTLDQAASTSIGSGVQASFNNTLAQTGDIAQASSGSVTTAINNGLDPGAAVSSVINTAAQSGGDMSAVISSSIDTGLSAALSSGVDTSEAVTTIVSGSITSSLSSGVDVTTAIDSTVGSSVKTGIANGVDASAVVTSSVNSAVSTALNNGASASTVVTGAVSSAVTSGLNAGADASSVISSSVTAAVSTATQSGANSTAVVAGSTSTAVSTAIASGVDASTAISSAVDSATQAGANASTASASSITAAITAGTDTNTAIAAVTGANSNITANSTTNNNVTSTTATDATTGVTSQTVVDNSSGASTTITTNNNITSQVTTVGSTTTTVTSDTSTGVTTQTTVDGTRSTDVTVDTTTNVTTQVVTDTATNTKVTVEWKPDGEVRCTFRDRDGQETVFDDLDVGDPPKVDVVAPLEPVKPEVKPETPKETKPTTTPSKSAMAASAIPGMVMGSELGRLKGEMLKSGPAGEQVDPLAAMKQRIEDMNAIDPALAAVIAQRLGVEPPKQQMPAYTYGQETSIDDILGMGKKEEPEEEPLYAQGGFVEPLRAAGGAMNPQFMYRAGGLGTREDFRHGKHVAGDGDGQSDDIPAWLADGEFVFPADVVSALGNGSTKAGTDKLYKMMHEIRARARSTKEKDLPPPAHKSPLDYLKKGK
jgi:hypothetical protein